MHEGDAKELSRVIYFDLMMIYIGPVNFKNFIELLKM